MTKQNKKLRKIRASGVKNQVLFPNCSEYVTRIHLSPKEKIKAKELLKQMDIEEDDKKYLKSYFNEDNCPAEFTSEDLVEPYELITETILAERKSKILKAVLDKKINMEQATELQVSLISGKTYLDIEIEEILEDYEKYKSLVNKAKIIDTLEKSDKPKHKWGF